SALAGNGPERCTISRCDNVRVQSAAHPGYGPPGPDHKGARRLGEGRFEPGPGTRRRPERRCSVRRMILLAAGLAALLAAAAAAQDYPTKPVRMIIPFPPGGSNDVVGRVIATHLGERLGKQVIVDNRAGAGGVIGTEVAANAPPDGYTLLIISIAHAVN